MLNMTALPTEPNRDVLGVQPPTQHTPCGGREGTKESDVLEKQCPLVRERCSNGITPCADSEIPLSSAPVDGSPPGTSQERSTRSVSCWNWRVPPGGTSSRVTLLSS